MEPRSDGTSLLTPAVGEQWYAVYTKRQKEHFADVRLLQLGIETFLPLIGTHRRGQILIRPLFPCYLFARFDVERRLYAVNHTDGINKVVTFDERPIPVDPSIVDSLRNRLGEQGYLEVRRPTLKPGEKVRVTEGPFQGFEGRIEHIRSRDRVIVLLSAIVSRARLELQTDMVELIRENT